MKTCYYELLGVERDVNTKKLKKAYRKAAAKWHPDKNYGNEEEATKRFKEIAEAYEVLSDPNERAWYDDHREQILLGVDPSSNESGDNLNIWSHFSTSCFSDFTDRYDGFYVVFDKQFQEIHKLERLANSDLEDESPTFGRSKSEWKQVSTFYSFWRNFRTSRLFAHADEYKPSDAPNRRIRRLIEQDNEKKRSAARKKFNELVRRLYSWVRRRDPRVQEHETEMARKKALIEKLEAVERERKQREQEERYQQARLEEQAKLDRLWETNPEMFDVEEVSLFECVACKKTFKSEKAMQNHENSKKHKKNVKKLRRQLEQEEAMFGLRKAEDVKFQKRKTESQETEEEEEVEPEKEVLADSMASDKEEEEEFTEPNFGPPKKKNKRKNQTEAVPDEKELDEDELFRRHMADLQEEEEPPIQTTRRGKKKKKRRRKQKDVSTPEVDEDALFAAQAEVQMAAEKEEETKREKEKEEETKREKYTYG